jgi:hypothetical protein
MAIDKSGYNRKIKVSQSTIDKIKTMGMTKALSKSGTANPEMKEALTRMYGARRVTAAAKANAPANFTAPKGANKRPSGRLTKGAVPPKKSGMSTEAKITAGAAGVAAGAVLLGSRGKAAGVAAKLSPGLAKSRVGKALGMAAKNNPNSAANVMKKTIADKTGSSVKFGPKGSFGKSTAEMAKAGKVGTKSEYAQKAMQDKARAYLASRAAAKAAPVKVNSAKPAAKAATKPKPTLKKKSMVAGGLGATTLKGDSAKKTNKK